MPLNPTPPPPPPPSDQSSGESIVVVHVGAGKHSVATLPKLKRTVHEALSATDFVKMCECIEKCPLTNTGYGSSLTTDGTVECDASFICVSPQGRNQGSLLGISGERYPIACTLDTYLELDSAHGPEWRRRGISPPISLIHSLLKKQTLKTNLVLPRAQAIFDHYSDLYQDQVSDTVGIIYHGFLSTHIAASSGGNFFKLPGRVGCSGIVGAGLDHAHHEDYDISCLCSGNGEDIIKTQLAASVCASMDYHLRENRDINHARILEDSIRKHAAKVSPLASPGVMYVGVLVLIKFTQGSSYLVYCHSTESFVFGYKDRMHTKRVIASYLENPDKAGLCFACGEFKLA